MAEPAEGAPMNLATLRPKVGAGGILTGIRPADLKPEIDVLSQEVDDLQSLVQQISEWDDDLRRTFEAAVNTQTVAVASWAGDQAQEVIDGVRPRGKWSDYGQTLLKQAQRVKQDLDEHSGWSGWFSNVVSWIGSKLETGVDAIGEKVAGLRRDLNTTGTQRAAVIQARTVFTPKKARLSATALDVLFGYPWDAAEAAWGRANDLVSALEAGVSMVRGGRASFQKAGDDVQIVALSGPGRQLLGALPVLAAGTVLATVAICAALIVSVRAYYQHADEVTRAETANLELQLVKEGKGAEVTELRKLRNTAEENRDPPSLAETIAKYTAGAAVAVGLGWGGWKLLERALFGGRR